MGHFTSVQLDSLIFNTEEVHREMGNVVSKTAKEFKDLTKRRQIESKPSGRLYARKRGTSFRRAHRASARGERPAPDTLKLVNSIIDKKIADTTAEVVAGADYAKYLNDPAGLDRPIMSEQDAAEAEIELQRNADAAIARLR